MKKPYEIIKLDRYTGKIQQPTLLLMKRSGEIIGKISNYRNWNISLVGNGIDEINFEVHKSYNGKQCVLWNDLIDLKIVEVDKFGRFEISVDYTDNTETVKSVHGISLEAELAQVPLYGFHVNDDDAMSNEITEFNQFDFDNKKFIPTVFYNPNDPKHSLLHRVLADKAPHWSIGDVTPYIALNENSNPEEVSSFQRTYTVDGDSIYDFLTGTVAKESNVIFIFDTLHRIINCYSLCNCIEQETGNIKSASIGEDTMVCVSKTKLANEFTISSNKDNVKNCFRVEGGDDNITDMVRAVNMNGSNYINIFSNLQYDDMSDDLSRKLKQYQSDFSEQEPSYIGENGIYPRLCKKYEELSYYKSGMMPDVEIKETTAEEQYNKILSQLDNESPNHIAVGVSSVNNYNDNLFIGITNNIEALSQILIDYRYKVSIIENSASYDSRKKQWKGNLQVKRTIDETDCFPKTPDDINKRITVDVNDDTLLFAKQKIEKALSKGSMLDIDFDIAEMDNDTELYDYFNQYSLNRLKSFNDGYNSCISILTTLGLATTGIESDHPVRFEIYDKYKHILDIVEDIYKNRQAQVEKINGEIVSIKKEQEDFQKKWNFKEYLGEQLYKEYCSYRREDTYKNDNYVSDGKSTAECLKITKKLIEAATEEAKKACVLQRTLSTSMNNLFALPEFEPLYEKFSLFNYIRVRTDDEILKLRIIGIQFDGDTFDKIQVTFSEQIESIDGKTDDTASIIKQAQSMSGSYPSTALQAKKGADAKNIVSDIYNIGLNAAKAMITNSDNNEVTITQSGIICKRMDDEGFYGEKQIRITGNMFVFTRNNWQSVELAVGETTFIDPENPNEQKQAYGIIAENIVGKLMVTERMYIGNKDGSVLITGNGIVIKRGTISWGNDEYGVNAPKISDIDGLNEFKNKVNAALTGSATTEIGSNYIISPKIGGGYLFIKDKRTTNNTKISVEINPNGTNFSGHNANYVFNITKDGNIIMGVSNNGDGYFNGEIEANKGHIGGVNGWNIERGKISSSSNSKIELNSNNGKISASYTYHNENSERIAEISEGSFLLHYDNNEMGRIHSALWANTQNKGMAIYCKPESKFLVIGHDNILGDGSYTPDIVINNGLNYNGKAVPVQILSDSYVQNKLYFNNTCHLSGSTSGMYCNEMFGINGVPTLGFALTVNGTGLIKGDLRCTAQTGVNMVHAYVQNSTHIGALAVNENQFGLWDVTHNRWLIKIEDDGQVKLHKSAFDTGSDKRLKSNIKNTNVDNALYQILSINHKEFTFKKTGKYKDIGYIAQELEKINPQMIIAPDNEGDFYYVDSFYLEAIITKAIQEFHKEYSDTIEDLNIRIKELENKIF